MPDRTLSRTLARTVILIVCCLSLSSVPGEASPLVSQDHDDLVATHCGSCHRKGGSGPFELQTSADLLKRRQFMKSVIESGLMPPWPYSGGVPLEGDRGLSEDDKRRFLELLSSEGGGDTLEIPEGAESSEPLTASPAIEELGPFRMRRSWTVPAEGGRRWFKGERDKRTFLMPVKNQEALRINRVSYRTTAPLAVAAVALSADTTGEARR